MRDTTPLDEVGSGGPAEAGEVAGGGVYDAEVDAADVAIFAVDEIDAETAHILGRVDELQIGREEAELEHGFRLGRGGCGDEGEAAEQGGEGFAKFHGKGE